MSTKKIIWLLVAIFLNIYFVNAQWQSCNIKLNSAIRTMYNDSTNNRLLAGGNFLKIGNDTIGSFGIFDGDSLKPLNNELMNYDVFSSIVFQNNIIIGGWFTAIGNNTSLKRIALWNGNQWQPMGSGFNGSVYNLREINNELYAVGTFDNSGTIEANGIAKWNGANWENVHNLPRLNPINDGPNYVYDICKYNNELYVAGNFDNFNSNIFNIVKYDGLNWVSVGGGIHGSYSDVNRMLVYNGKLVVAGMFYKQNGNIGNFIMTWDGQQWEELGGGTWGIYGNLGTLGTIFDMKIFNNKLYICGQFYYAGSTPAPHVAVWDGYKWCGFSGNFDIAYSLAIFKDTLYIGSGLTIDNDTVNWFAKWGNGLTPDTCGFVGIQENSFSDNINIFPNPANTSFEITTYNEQIIKEISLYSIEGKLLKQQSYSENKVKINTSELPIGMYLIEVQTKEKRMFQKLIISH